MKMRESVRVLHIVGSLGIGGIQSYLLELYRHIDHDKIQFDFVVHIKTEKNYASEIELLGGKIFYIDDDAFEKKAWVKYIKYWKTFFREHPYYKIVHGHLRSTSAIYLKEAKKAGCYTIAHSHATSNGYGKTAKAKDIMQYPTRYIADYCMGCSKNANEWMFGKKRSNSSTCCVVRNAIDLNKFVFDDNNRTKKREQFDIEDTTFVIGAVGRLVEQKNHSLLIDAFAKAIQTRKNLKLIIAGDGPLKNRLQKQIKDLSLSDSVLLLGSRNDIDELLQMFDCFAMPSRDEGLGIAIVEAQAADLPVIISPAITEEACITENIIKLETYEVDEWAEALVKAKKRNRSKNDTVIRDAGYDIEAVARWLMDFYINCYPQE